MRAARAGWSVLQEGRSALDAAEEAVRRLEEDEAFDAGKGAVLTSAGEVELGMVSVVAGDGGIQMTLNELGTLRQIFAQTTPVCKTNL